jgi:hypothetical protein
MRTRLRPRTKRRVRRSERLRTVRPNRRAEARKFGWKSRLFRRTSSARKKTIRRPPVTARTSFALFWKRSRGIRLV